MENNKQTAVQWLVEKLKNYDSNMIQLFENEIEQAIEMEKEQIVHAFVVAENHQWDGVRHGCHYYRQKYEKNNQSI